MSKSGWIAVSAGLALLAEPALGQSETARSRVALEEVVVTAQRREENIQDVPISLAAFSANDIDSRNLNTLAELTEVSPSLQRGGEGSFAIRGVGSLVFTQTIDSSVAIAVDDVNYGRPGLGVNLFADVERVEVLYGPQGLLFGKNASAGLINVVTVKPQLKEFAGSIDLEYTVLPTTPHDADGYITRGMLNIPVGEQSALRLNALWSDREPVARYRPADPHAEVRVDDDNEQKFIKGKWLTEVSDNFSFYLIGDYSETDGRGGMPFRSVGNGSLVGPILAGDGITPGKNNLEYVADGEYFAEHETGGLQANLSYRFDNGYELINVTAWRYFERLLQLDTDHSSIDGLNVNYSNVDYDQFTSELRLVLPSDGRLKGQMGLFYLDSKLDGWSKFRGAAGQPGFPICFAPGPCSYDNFDLTILGSDSDSVMDTRSYAAFGQFDVALTDGLSLIAGGRLTRDEIEFDLLSGQEASKYIQNIGGLAGHFKDETTNTNFTWKLGAQWSATDDIMLYAAVSTGYKAPGFNDSPTPLGDLAVDEETVLNKEIGLKSMWFDNRLMVNATLFDQKFEDLQVQVFDPIAQTFYTQNAAEATVRGLELNLSAALAEGLTLNSSMSLLDSEFDDFPGAQCFIGQGGCDINNTFNAKGLETPGSSEVVASTQLIYEFPITSALNGFVEGNWYYRSDSNFSINRDPGTKLDAYSLYGFSAGLNSEAGWGISLFCKNCTDKRVPAGIQADPGDATRGVSTYSQAFEYNSVRVLGVNLRYAF